MKIDKDISEYVCTAAAIGHIKKTYDMIKNSKRKFNIVYEPGTTQTYPGQDDETKKHNDIISIIEDIIHEGEIIELHKKDTKVNIFTKTGEINKNARIELLIMPQNRKISADELRSLNKSVFSGLNILNQFMAINKLNTPLTGAYIGGVYYPNNDLLVFAGPSKIVIKDRIHELIGIEEKYINDSYIKNKNLSDAIISNLQFIYGKAAATLECKRPQIILNAELEHYKPGSTQSLDTTKIFGSVHGLVHAIIKYNVYKSTDNSIACEFAYGKDTTKVGSCIPCSIFASSCQAPVNYTHLGRGDNWNFPNDGVSSYRKEWNEYIYQCYDTGNKLLQEYSKKHNITRYTIMDDIGEVFLHSLMYEGKFIDKISSVLKYQFK